MSRRIPKTMIWILLGLIAALAPLACGSDGSDKPDAASEIHPDSMTGG